MAMLLIHHSRFFLLYISILFFLSDRYHSATADRSPSLAVPIGVVLDANSQLGSMVYSCMKMAVLDFYAEHPNYTTRLQLHLKNADTVLDANLAVVGLLEHEQVHGILGPQGSTEDIFISELGRKVRVPIISFTARTLALPTTDNIFFVRTTIDDSIQAQALAAICHGFEWSQAVLLYEDTEYGHQFLSHLSNTFRKVGIGLVNLTAFSSSAKNGYIFQQLSMLSREVTKVFLVHMNPSLGFRLFTVAKKVGMMSEGYAWIVSDALSIFFNSIDSATRDSMEGAVGIRPYVPFSHHLQNFQQRWKRKGAAVADLNIYGLWAYDTVTALAIAVERIGPVNSTSLAQYTNLRVSSFGPLLLTELSRTKLKGLSGDFQLVNGTLKPSAFEIINVIGSGERRVGYWAPGEFNSTIKEVKNVVWAGDSLVRPKGWAIPPSGGLRVGVPWKCGFKEFVNVVVDPVTNYTNATGFSVDIFLAARKLLPFPIEYKFVCYNDTTKTNWGYDSMLRGIPQKYDMVVGDTTIWAPRASYVDFTLPYLESRVVLVVKNDKALDMWIFTKPLRWDLWLSIAAASIFVGVIIWILEHQSPTPIPSDGGPLQITYLAPMAALAFQDRTILSNKWSVFVLVCWLFMAFILMQSFTANLSAILTLDQLKFSFSEGHYFGYHAGSFLENFLVENLNIEASRLRPYTSLKEFHDAMSRGSKNGGVDAIFDELPYIKLFLTRYESLYKIVGPTYRTDGFGFAFPIGSPLAAYFSRAILNVTQGPEMISIEQHNLGPGYSSLDPLSSMVSQGSSSLTPRQFAGLFIVVGSLALLALACSKTRTLSNIAAHFINSRVSPGPTGEDHNVVLVPVGDSSEDDNSRQGADGNNGIAEDGVEMVDNRT